MERSEELARYCRLCGRPLEGAERVAALCARCKSLGEREGALDVERTFERALAEYHLPRGSLVGSRMGTWAFVFSLVVVVWCLVLGVATREPIRAIVLGVTLLAPLEVLALCMGFVALLERRTDRTLALLAVILNAAALAVFARRLASVMAMGRPPSLSQFFLELLK
ncbi:MAG: hypothetical protein V2A58_01685 [Planctomycetota bacterium]